MSNSDSKDDMTALVVRSAHDLATRSSLVIRGLRDISNGFQEDSFKSVDDRTLELFHQDKFEEAIAVCTAGLDANPKDECLWLIKGMCFSKQEKYDELLKCVVPLLEIDGKNPTYWYLAARVLHRLSKFEDELEHWRKLIEIDPQHKGAWRGIGDCLFNLGKYEEAVEAFDSELRLNPSDEYCQSRKATSLDAVSGHIGKILGTVESEEWKELIPTLILTLDHWWSEPSPKTELSVMTPRTRSFNFACNMESISGREQLLGKQMSVFQRSKESAKVYWVADALFVDSDATAKKIQPNSELIPVVLELSWFCTPEKSDADCVLELLSVAEDTFGIDDTFGTVMQFIWDGE
jgi:tetratricopeptide (TPR) repeat protein